MRGRLKILSVIVIVVMVAAALWSASPIFLGEGEPRPGKVVWVDYDAGWATAQRLNRPVMLYFHSDTCPSCKLMEANVFGNEEIAGFLNENFVSISINVDEPAGTDLARKYKVLALPTVIFFTPDGVELDKIHGYWPPENFRKVAETMLKTLRL
ncbi:TPA: thioredoxin family protein [Candidatus Bathyarchaeota archaeon]|nr:thioredoxin family protein [Candidatus Bathyarchaeota archaeon]